MLILMILNQVKSINASGLSEKYLKRIIVFFDRVDDQLSESIQTIFNCLAMEMFFKWYQLSKSYRRKHPIIISIDDGVIEKFGKRMERLIIRWPFCPGIFIISHGLRACYSYKVDMA